MKIQIVVIFLIIKSLLTVSLKFSSPQKNHVISIPTDKRYKVIINLGQQNEQIQYFNILTHKKYKELLATNNFVLLQYDNFLLNYAVIDRSINLLASQVDLFNNNINKYCERY